MKASAKLIALVLVSGCVSTPIPGEKIGKGTTSAPVINVPLHQGSGGEVRTIYTWQGSGQIACLSMRESYEWFCLGQKVISQSLNNISWMAFHQFCQTTPDGQHINCPHTNYRSIPIEPQSASFKNCLSERHDPEKDAFPERTIACNDLRAASIKMEFKAETPYNAICFVSRKSAELACFGTFPHRNGGTFHSIMTCPYNDTAGIHQCGQYGVVNVEENCQRYSVHVRPEHTELSLQCIM